MVEEKREEKKPEEEEVKSEEPKKEEPATLSAPVRPPGGDEAGADLSVEAQPVRRSPQDGGGRAKAETAEEPAKPAEGKKPPEEKEKSPEKVKAPPPRAERGVPPETGESPPKEKKRKKIRNLNLEEIEKKLKETEEAMGGLQSKYAQHLLQKKEELLKEQKVQPEKE